MEKEGSKSGVGGFFQLFDWKAKSRKKLFSSKSDFAERFKQGKRSDGNLPMTRLHLPEEDETGARSSIKGGSDYSCASSVTDEDGYGAKAPSVVARLMGLDSMPTSNESFSTQFFDSQSLQDAPHLRKNFDYHHDHQLMYSGNLYNKGNCSVRNFVESKPQKFVNRPLEKFQSEILPPKSAKSIPITHHKLLSPIKNPGFVPTKNAAHIMEAAARIIEPGSRANTRSTMPLVGSSSAPLKVKDLKEKVEAAQKTQLAVSSCVPMRVKDLKEKAEAAHRTSRLAEASRRPVESNAVKYLKGQSLNKSWNGSIDSASSSRASEIEEGTAAKNKGKSVSLAIQAKVNVQRREGISSSNSRSFVTEKEEKEFKSRQPFRIQPNIQKNLYKKPASSSSSNVLRQNNQKQNCAVDKDKLPSKLSVTNNFQGRKLVSVDSSSTRQKTLSRTVGNSKPGLRKLGSDFIDSEKGNSYSSTKNYPRKKRSIERDSQFGKSQVVDNLYHEKSKKVTQSDPIADSHYTWAEDSKIKGMDVVSFTFSAPLARSTPCSEASSAQVGQRKDNVFTDNTNKRLLLDTESMKLSSLGYNVIGPDALSLLLEQKLKELTHQAEYSSHDSFKVGSSSSSVSNLPDPAPTCNPFDFESRTQDKEHQDLLARDKLDRHYYSDFHSSKQLPPFSSKHKFQGVDEMDECSSNSLDGRNLRDYRHPSPVSTLEASFSNESCNSSDSAERSSIEGTKHCSSVLAQEVPGSASSKKFPLLEADMELSDSASSNSATLAKTNSTTTVSKLAGPTKWEMGYIKQILCNVELMFRDFSLGRSREMINPHLFDLLENRNSGLKSEGESKLTRKVLFDCVSECMDIRCMLFVGGGFETWAKGEATVRRKEWLAEQVCKEVSGWSGMGDCMVDELVDKDMSSQYGRWLDFEVDAFELGVEIGGMILNSLVKEVVDDILQI